MHILKLPEEVLVDIAKYCFSETNSGFEYLTERCINISKVQDIANLALSSKQLSRTMRPVLVHSFNQVGVCSMYLFIRTLLDSDLAQNVKNIRTQVYDDPDSLHGGQQFLNAEDEEDIIKSAANLAIGHQTVIHEITNQYSVTEELAEGWRKDLKSGHWDAACALLLCACPKITSLKIRGWNIEPRTKNSNLLQAVRKAGELGDAGGRRYSMTSLSDISISHCGTEGGIWLMDLVPWLKLRSIRQFHGHMIYADASCLKELADNSNDDNFELRALPITSLTFSQSNVEPEALAMLIRSCGGLTHFAYEQGGRELDDNEFYPQLLSSALLERKDTLEELTLLFMEDNRWGHYDDEGETLGSLSTFTRLRYVRATGNLIHDDQNLRLTDTMPASLETLIIEEALESDLTQLNELLNRTERPLLNLKYVRIHYFSNITYEYRTASSEYDMHVTGFSQNEKEKMQALCEQRGIELVVFDSWRFPAREFFDPEADY